MSVPKIKTPLPDTPIYTYPNYLYDVNHNIERNTFAYVFYDTYEKNFKQAYDFAMSGKRGLAREDITGYDLSDITNKFERSMRGSIDYALQDFLLKNGGAIEAWPQAKMQFDIVKNTTSKTYDPDEEEYNSETYESGRYTITFDYFGTECGVDPDNYRKVRRKESGRKVRKDYYYQRDAYEEAMSQESILKHEMEAAKRNPIEKFKSFITLIPILLAILIDIVLIIGAIFKIEAIREFIGPVLPLYMTLSDLEGYSAIHIFLLPFIGGALMVFLQGCLEPNVNYDVGSFAEQKKKYDEYVNSAEYKAQRAAGPVDKNSYESQSLRWHKEWFDATK